MSAPTQPRNHAARMGRWSAGHWKTATVGWLAFVVVAFVLGGLVGTKNIDQNTSGPGESGRMERILDAGFKQPAGESVLIESRSLVASDPAFTAAIEDVVAKISKLEAVQNVRSPLDPANAGQIAKNGHAALVEFQIRGDSDKATALRRLSRSFATNHSLPRISPGPRVSFGAYVAYTSSFLRRQVGRATMPAMREALWKPPSVGSRLMG